MITNRRFKRWFDLNLGWLFINGRKREGWHAYLMEEYGTIQGSGAMLKFIYFTASVVLRVIGFPIVVVAVIIALPAIILLIFADDLESRRNLDPSDE